jgi:NADH-quinone oxidoreductase subunit J
MEALFYLASAVAVGSTALTITRLAPAHALLYLIVSLLSVAVVFFTLGAPFAAVLEVLVYAGAIMVLFVFVMMMLNLGDAAVAQERQWLKPGMWIGPALMSAVLLAEIAWLPASDQLRGAAHPVGAKAVGIALYGPYLLAVELASMLLLAGLVAAYHIGRRDPDERRGA